MRLNEVYRSVQGEGPKVGIPTTFVRFGGCNLRCPDWACDSPHAIYPKEYRHEWRKVSAGDLAGEIVEASTPGQNICLTGGEPFLQPHQELQELVAYLSLSGRRLECFSNGTLSIPEWAFEDIDFVLDYKLPGSGEWKLDHGQLINVNASTFIANLHTALESSAAETRHSIKFTVASLDDFETAVREWCDICSHFGDTLQVFVGAVWGKVEPSDIVQWILNEDVPWRLNLQTHKYIWDADERRR